MNLNHEVTHSRNAGNRADRIIFRDGDQHEGLHGSSIKSEQTAAHCIVSESESESEELSLESIDLNYDSHAWYGQ